MITKVTKTSILGLILITITSVSLKAQSQTLVIPPVETQQKNTSPTYDLRMKHFKSSLNVTEASIDTYFSAFSFDEVQDRSQLVQLALVPRLKIKLAKQLDFTAVGLIALSQGRVQTRFDNPAFSNMNLNELVLNFYPVNFLELELGALNQNHLNTPMLMFDRAFPGAQLKSKFEVSDNFKAQLKAQYSIPNSVSFETDRTQNEPVPQFLTQGFDFDWKPQSWLNIRGDVHHFTFNDLPSVVAFQSGRLGNEVIGTQSSQSMFAYGFDGFSQSYKFDFLFSRMVAPNLNLQIIDNNQAPSDRSRSQWTGLGLDIFLRDLILSPSIAYFFAESDSVPALYSDVRLGRNNREGFSYKFKVNFKTLGFSLSANYVQANLIEPDPIQNDLRTLEFLLELPSVQF